METVSCTWYYTFYVDSTTEFRLYVDPTTGFRFFIFSFVLSRWLSCGVPNFSFSHFIRGQLVITLWVSHRWVDIAIYVTFLFADASWIRIAEIWSRFHAICSRVLLLGHDFPLYEKEVHTSHSIITMVKLVCNLFLFLFAYDERWGTLYSYQYALVYM